MGYLSHKSKSTKSTVLEFGIPKLNKILALLPNFQAQKFWDISVNGHQNLKSVSFLSENYQKTLGFQFWNSFT